MGLEKSAFYLILLWSLYFNVKANLSQEKCVFNLQEFAPVRGVRNIEVKLNTNIKQETINSRELLSELIKKEFELLRKDIEVQQLKLLETIESQKEEIKNVKKKFNEQIMCERTNKSDDPKQETIYYRELLSKEFKAQQEILIKLFEAQKEELKNVKNQLSEQIVFLKNQLTEQTQKIDQNFKNKQEAPFATQIQKLLENINENLLNQKTFQEKLVDQAIQTVRLPQYDSSRWNASFNCIRNCDPIRDLPDSCESAMNSDSTREGIYLLHIPKSGLSPFFVQCKRINGKVWTIMQRREDGSVDFYKNWETYKNGFGNLYGEFWLGLERLHVMTTKHKYELHVWLEGRSGKKAYAHYDEFSIASEAEKYKLFVKGYTGNAGNSLGSNDERGTSNNMKFSTYDNRNDRASPEKTSCARTFPGGWWFNSCYRSHLNGLYVSTIKEGVDWIDFEYKLRYAQMGIRRV